MTPPKFPILIIAGATMVSVSTGCRFLPTERLEGDAWKSASARTSRSAGASIYPESAYPALRDKDSFGICFSGGGNRSAVATLGQLRALHATGILDRAKYVSAVSGGSWGSAPWVFLQDQRPGADEHFLGKLVMPSELKSTDLCDRPEEGTFARSASSSEIGIGRYFLRLGGDESFGKEIGKIFLRDHGLDSPKRIPVYGQDEMNRTIARNPKLTRDDFLVCQEGRPYFIAGSAVSRRDNLVASPEKLYVPFEFTTSYAGTSGYSRKSELLWRFDVPVGGGYVENAIYDGWPTHQRPAGADRFHVTVSKATPFPWLGASSRLSLPDILASSGSAPTAALPCLADILGFPEFYHYSPEGLPHLRTRELLHTDGGAIENLGVMPLLARGVKNLLVFSNTSSPYIKGRLPSDIGYLFGDGDSQGILGMRTRQLARIDHVFDDPDQKKRSAMIRSFDAALERKTTLIHFDTYTVRDQAFYGVRGGGKVNVCWIILGPAGAIDAGPVPQAGPELLPEKVDIKATSWFRAIQDPAAKSLIRENEKELKGFPHYKTFLNNGQNLIALTPLQVNALAHYTSFSVAVNAEEIKSHLNLRSGGRHR